MAGANGTPREPASSLFGEEKPPALTAEQESAKRSIYEKMSQRRRKFVDRIGYDLWNPFQAPKDPLDIRTERTERTLDELISEFFNAANASDKSRAWRQGAMECALGIIRKDEKFQGIYDFCVWYQKLLEREGYGK